MVDSWDSFVCWNVPDRETARRRNQTKRVDQHYIFRKKGRMTRDDLIVIDYFPLLESLHRWWVSGYSDQVPGSIVP